jgi:hypothetical protein
MREMVGSRHRGTENIQNRWSFQDARLFYKKDLVAAFQFEHQKVWHEPLYAESMINDSALDVRFV